MVPKFFGQFLLEQQAVTGEQLLQAIQYQEKTRQKMGEVAIAEGLMTEMQVREIHEKQKTTDKFFGDLALEAGYLNEDQLSRVVTLQKQSHMYLGEVLVKLELLAQEEVDRLLARFQEDQKDVVPVFRSELDFPGQQYAPHFVDLTVKLLRRMAEVQAKPGTPAVLESAPSCGDVSVLLSFSGDIQMKYMLRFSAEVARHITCEFLEEEIDDAELIRENAAEFVNIVCGNAVTLLEKEGLRTRISVPTICDGSRQKTAEMDEQECAVEVPLATTMGSCAVVLITKREQAAATAARAGSGKKVLIVDDSKSVAYKLRKIVDEMDGYEVAGHALSGEDGLAAYREIRPDLVTMDLVLPGMDGIECVRKIREFDKDANIVVISSVGGGQERLFDAIQAGARNVITKPFNADTVKSVFRQLTE